MYYLTITAQRKNAKRHIIERGSTIDELLPIAENLNPCYLRQIYSGSWDLVRTIGEEDEEKTDLRTVISSIQTVITSAERMKNAYFFTPPTSAGGRRSYEKTWSAPRVEWTDGKNSFSAEFVVSCSCRNVYAHGEYYRNGQKTTLTAIRNSLKRLQEREEAQQ